MNRTTRTVIIVVVAAVFGGAIWLKESGREAVPQPETQAASQTLPRLVDLGSDTCVPCKMLAPILEELARDYSSHFQVEVIDARKNRKAAEPYGIRIIPTQIFYDAEGLELYRHEGFISKADILAKWQELGIDTGPGQN